MSIQASKYLHRLIDWLLAVSCWISVCVLLRGKLMKAEQSQHDWHGIARSFDCWQMSSKSSISARYLSQAWLLLFANIFLIEWLWHVESIDQETWEAIVLSCQIDWLIVLHEVMVVLRRLISGATRANKMMTSIECFDFGIMQWCMLIVRMFVSNIVRSNCSIWMDKWNLDGESNNQVFRSLN